MFREPAVLPTRAHPLMLVHSCLLLVFFTFTAAHCARPSLTHRLTHLLSCPRFPLPISISCHAEQSHRERIRAACRRRSDVHHAIPRNSLSYTIRTLRSSSPST